MFNEMDFANKINFRGYEGYIVDYRVKKDDKLDGFHYYHLRHDDCDYSEPITIEDYVLVNHWGTIWFHESIHHLLTPWGNGRLETDLTEEEKDSIWFAINE